MVFYRNEYRIIFDLKIGEFYFSGPDTYGRFIYNNDDSYAYFYAPPTFVFFVDKTLLGGSNKWLFAGYSFSSVSSNAIYGYKDLFLIDAVCVEEKDPFCKSDSVRYYYSAASGLVGIEFMPPSDNLLFEVKNKGGPCLLCDKRDANTLALSKSEVSCLRQDLKDAFERVACTYQGKQLQHAIEVIKQEIEYKKICKYPDYKPELYVSTCM